jgi:recombination associated protein RdgC
MWFKNLYFFAFTRPFELSEDQLEKHLAEHLFTPCGSTEQSHFGWVNAIGKHGHSTVHSASGNFLICARKEEKILPAPVVKDMLEAKVALLEVEQGRSATKKEREQFKEDIIFELLPRAFSRVTDTHAYINAEHNLIVVNSGSRGKAEDLLALLRKVIGTLPVTSVSPETAPDELMTDWLNEKSIGDNFTLGMEAEFHALGDDGAVVRVKNQDLASEEIKTHLDADKYVVKLALEWDEAMSFILCDDLAIKRLKFFDVLQEQNDDIDSDDIVAKIDADFSLMAGEINRLINDLLSEFNVKATDYLESEK